MGWGKDVEAKHQGGGVVWQTKCGACVLESTPKTPAHRGRKTERGSVD
jgi:hypothetical protein